MQGLRTAPPRRRGAAKAKCDETKAIQKDAAKAKCDETKAIQKDVGFKSTVDRWLNDGETLIVQELDLERLCSSVLNQQATGSKKEQKKQKTKKKKKKDGTEDFYSAH
eukprot:s8209_g1.t1